MRGGGRLLVAVAGLLAFAVLADAADAPRIVAVAPAARDSLLVCRIATEGLPDAPSRETLASGLPSALVFALSVLDGRGKEVGGSRAEIRIEPDLWEERYVVNTPLVRRGATSLEQLQGLLGNLPPLPVIPLARLDAGGSYRIRARLAVYPLAPAAARASRDRFAGEGSLRDPDRRELSVGVDALLRFFLGKGDDTSWSVEAMSTFFSPPALPDDRDADEEP